MEKDSPYNVSLYWSEEDGVYVAEVPELPGCATHGSTSEEAMGNARDAIESWIIGAKESGNSIPEPIAMKKKLLWGN
jgi:predicted RNase H-like HicB family nuclease